jgi:mannitol-1-/sugar-/sorbitol-6-phosphatase
MIEVQCDALLFDLDGVLINSTPAVARVWTRWAAKHGFDPAEVVAYAHGRPSLNTIRHLLPNADHEAENRIVERWEIEDVADVVPLPGAVELLASLPAGRWTIVTSCTRDLAEARFRAAGLTVPKAVVTANDIVRGKPDPEPYLKGAALLGFSAARCLVFEDVAAGIQAGRAAGARVVAFTTTLSPEKLREAAPDWILRSCADVRANPEKSPVTLDFLLE